ncbi:MAG: type II secretion system F family protein [Lentisphaeria bacterium]|nr:type II secretion system F family protein [Lentisphaerota bacterium]MBR2625837.1 type II secretion system F family protein [Lentisphaeria bacterium]
MPQYTYSGWDGNRQKNCKGKIEAASQDAATMALRSQNIVVTEIREVVKVQKTKAKAKSGGGLGNMTIGTPVIKRKELTVVTRQLAILLSAGLPLIRSLRTLEKQAKNPPTMMVLGKTADIVEGGATFAEALSQSPESFDKLYLNMVRAGEASGAMEIILDRLAGFMEKAARIAGKVKSAMIYPSVIMSIAILAVVGLMIFIVPNFRKIFSDLLGPDEPLPGITEFLIACSDSMIETWYYWLIGVGIIIVGFKVAARIPAGKYALDWCKYYMPLFGPLIMKTAVSRFSRTLGTLMSSGVPVLSALAIVKETSGNDVVSDAVQKVYDAVKEGEGISGPLSRTKVFPEMVISMVEVGEETGKLPEMLDKIANTYDEEVDNSVSALTSLIEPLMIVGLAGVVGTIVIALFLPLTKIIEKMSG